MSQTIEQIAKALEARAEGDLTIEVTGASEPAAAGPDQIALAMSEKYAEGLQAGKARAALVWEGADWRAYGLEAAVFVTRPRLAMAGLSKAFDPGPSIASGVHPSCVIDPTAVIGADAAIGPFTIVGPDVRIGPGARIVGQVTIGEGARIGAEALIHAGVRIGAQVVIGDRFVCQPGAVIGSDGFSFVTPDPSGVEEIRQTLEQREEITEQKWTRIHSLGTVEIGDDVEIGANTCIDRGTVRATAIGSGSKLDNLVHIGHNVQVGEDCLLCGQVGVAGSTRIGHRVVLAGQCGVSDNITVGDDVIAAGGTNIYTNVPKGRTIWGSPAVKMETQLEINKSLRRLPRLFAQMAELRETVTKLTQKGGTE
ncbi:MULTISPECIES: UDP-3-O-(3-hydroxymyristoyl)glucosamine N-acyltransferase [Thioclava]|uniref:UDP-3-O-acylglucosamine N-acyltransferase n=1 Tax=Thioclava nitratireducens TaxID=1915078 RepID=A0ABM6IGL6_9RHOB|nr:MULTISPECIES: UDP-3-O-(3-hydroxymyristoyl)glucosamine N-acyltransferase [Thioclava]AQS47946.1 UDP-3-O-(3-hydroxymyristoyl)glucosamine N-acyltransferase [Thioclava nitratireducens]OWY06994.1 UDP-3-O-(3-hydroxymyristoyl)glucosamine N-acyltransferase [Thioclava sp. IC9]OWY12579.1 UDP-3-O-(3-hydroxymyristoyl)glucosamine N-acyltransferase [Thioclava sp. F34-6]